MKSKFNRDDKIAGIIMLIVIAVCIYFICFDNVDPNKISRTDYSNSENETSERHRLAIRLNKNTINKLIDLCNEVDDDIDIEKVDLTTTIDSTGMYVDEYATSVATVQDDSEYELGAIYFNTSILLRYISKDKQFKTIVAGQEVSKDINVLKEVTYRVVDINNLDSIYCVIKSDQSDTSENKDISSVKDLSDDNNFLKVALYPSIYAYRYNINDLLLNIKELEVNNKELIESYCTYSGYEEIRSISDNIQRVNIIEAGTTSVENPVMDRILVQYTDNADNYKAIIIKINSDGLIYDIDSLN